jgi:hypothetical protein
LDDEEIIVRSTHEAVVLQPEARVGFAIMLVDIAWYSEMPWEMSVVHGTSKCLWARPFRTEATPLTIITAPTAWVSCALLGLRIIAP